MEQFSRRLFFRRAGGVAAVVGAASVAPMSIAGAAVRPSQTGVVEPDLSPNEDLAPDEHLVAHVIDARSGAISLFIGQREVIIHDRKVAARLVRAAR